jgi:hypothetical protein
MFSSARTHAVYYSRSTIIRYQKSLNFTWIEIIIRGHLSYKTTFTLTQMWPLNTSWTALWKLSKSNLLVTNFCVLRRQMFGFYRLNWQIFLTRGLYLKFGLYRIPFHSSLCLDRFVLIILHDLLCRTHAVSYSRSTIIRYQKSFLWFMTK